MTPTPTPEVVVPRDPTEAMISAGSAEASRCGEWIGDGRLIAAYRAMIAASPQPVVAPSDLGRGWVPVAEVPLWTDGIVTDGVNVAMAQLALSDHGDQYWAVDPEGSLTWEPTHISAGPSA